MATCTNRLDWDCHGIRCELPSSHEGDHEHRGTDGLSDAERAGMGDPYQRTEPRPTSYEFRWRETDAP